MRICTGCYKKLYHQMFTPYDYIRSAEVGKFTSTCCNVEALAINGRQYKKTVRGLEEKRKLAAWSQVNADKN